MKHRDSAAPSTPDSEEWTLLDRIFPEDVNRRQSFELKRLFAIESTEPWSLHGYDQIKLVFEQSSDFFGRIVLYDLAIEVDSVHSQLCDNN